MLQNAATYLDEYGLFTFTSVSVFEVLFGLQVKRAMRQIEDFSETITEHEEITPTATDYRLAAQICAALQRAGTPVGSFDPLIAACAVGLDLPLVTGNTRHHGFIQSAGFGLRLLNWREPQE